MKVYFVSLGCPKNLNDTEVLMGKFVTNGYEITLDPAQAEIIVVNTCAFLKSARKEALSVIKEMSAWKKKGICQEIYVAGCLPKWLDKTPGSQKITRGVKIDGIINSLGLANYYTPRIKATPPWYAYVKIAEGCNNLCAYCLIPKIRGRLKVRPATDIIKEVKQLANHGVKEVIFIAQDTAAYPDFASLLAKTARIRGIHWIRVMYAHPKHLTDEILTVMAKEPKVVKYLDLPIQHACDKILTAMNRRYSRRDLEELISKIRRRNFSLRTSVIVGFPGENEADFKELLDFIKQVKFQKLGIFTYQREDGTPAAKMRGQVTEKIKVLRAKKLMRVQARISKEINTAMIGKSIEVIVEKGASGRYVGRSFQDAPEIDGRVFINHSGPLQPGEIVKAKVTGSKTYDLIGCST